MWLQCVVTVFLLLSSLTGIPSQAGGARGRRKTTTTAKTTTTTTTTIAANPLPAAADAANTTTANSALWPSISDAIVARGNECAKLGRWTCVGYRYSPESIRGHYVDRNCACDDLCVLLEDCCPDAPLLGQGQLREQGQGQFREQGLGQSREGGSQNPSPLFSASSGSDTLTPSVSKSGDSFSDLDRTHWDKTTDARSSSSLPRPSSLLSNNGNYSRSSSSHEAMSKALPADSARDSPHAMSKPWPKESEVVSAGWQVLEDMKSAEKDSATSAGRRMSSDEHGEMGANSDAHPAVKSSTPQSNSPLPLVNAALKSNDDLGDGVFNDANNNGASTALQKLELRRSLYARYKLTKHSFSCVTDKSISVANDVSVVSRCPDVPNNDNNDISDDDSNGYEFMPSVQDLCHNASSFGDDDMLQRLPVSGIDSGVLYRNMYCALCHEEQYLYWVAGIDCSSRSELPYNENSSLADMPLNSTECQLKFTPPSASFAWRACQQDVTSTCSTTFKFSNATVGAEIATRCEEAGSEQRLWYGMTKSYKNEFCALCNHEDLTSLMCYQLSRGATITKKERLPFSFSILLDINTYSGSTTVGRGFTTREVERTEEARCDQGQVFDPFKAACRPVACGPHRKFVNQTCVDLRPPQQDLTSQANYSFSGSSASKGRANCTYILLNATEYMILPDGTLELLGTETFYNDSQYVVKDGNVYLCVGYLQNYTVKVNVTEKVMTSTLTLVEGVISACGICVSLVALLLTAFVYSSLRPLRNIPGKNLLSLVCSLFMADVLFLAGASAENESLACALIGGVMHYFFLASFMWMNVAAVDVWFTFSKAFVKAGDRGKSSKRFILYSAYAWLTPLAFVVPAVVLQLLHPESSFSPHYGAALCWLSNKNALLVFFAAPLFFLLVLNVVFFLISARNISQARKASARMLGKEDDGKMSIYVKLTVVMGITWIFGFLSALVPENPILKYVFLVLNTLQGLFICIAFVFTTTKVMQLLKAKFRGRKKHFRVTKSASTDITNLSKSLSAQRKASTTSVNRIEKNLVV